MVQEIESWLDEQMVYAQTRICSREWDTQNSLIFLDTNRLPNPGQLTRPWTCQIVDFPIPADHREKMRGNEKRDK